MSWKGSSGGARPTPPWHQSSSSQQRSSFGASQQKPVGIQQANSLGQTLLGIQQSSPAGKSRGKGAEHLAAAYQTWVAKNREKMEAAEQQRKIAEEQKRIAAAEQQQKIAAASADLKVKVALLTTDLDLAERQVDTVVDLGKKTLDNEKATASALKSSVESVEQHKTKLVELQESIQKERDEARKSSPPAAFGPLLPEFAALMDKSKLVLQKMLLLMGRLKPKALKVQQEADLKAKESKDSATFKPILAKITKNVAVVEDAINSLAKKAAPIIAKAPEGEALDKAVASIETAASETMTKLVSARTEIAEATKTALTYAPEAGKAARTSLGDLQKQVLEGCKKVPVYQAFKKELPKLVACQVALNEISEKVDGHEKPMTNATKLSDMSKLDKEKIDAIDKLLTPVKTSIKEAVALITQKSRNADPASQAKFTDFKKKCDDINAKIEAIYSKIKKQRDVIRSLEFVSTATEKLKKAEEGWKRCQEAEMPFLTGVEFLGEQNEAALKVCAEAIDVTVSAITDARGYVRERLVEVKSFEKDLCENMTSELTPFNAKFQAVDASLAKFKKEHAERKIIAIMSDALESVEALEKKMGDMEAPAKELGSANIEDATIETISEAIEKAKICLNESTAGLTETKKIVAEKAREAKAPSNDPASVNIHSRMNSAKEKLDKLRLSINFGEKVVKAKKAVAEGEKKLGEVESEVEQLKKFEGAEFTATSVKTFGEACANANLLIKAVSSLIQPHLGGAPPKAKAILQGYAERKAEAQKVVDKLKADTKDAREEVQSGVCVADAESSTAAAEAAANQMENFEKPFIVGGDLPLATTLELIKKCEEAAVAVKKATTDATNAIKEKSQVVKSFGAVASSKVKEDFASMTERVKQVTLKSASFEKDLRERSKSAKLREASAKLDEIDALLTKTVAAAEPFTKEGGADMSEDDAKAPLKAFMDLDKELSKMLSGTKTLILARLGEQKGNAENTETLKKLQERLSKIQQELAPVKKATKMHEQRALGKQMLAEAKEQVDALEAQIKNATDACAPLLENGGAEYLVDTSICTLVSALQIEKELTEEKMFEEVAKGKPAKEKDFVAYLKALPETISHDELNAFSDERRVEIFKRVSANGKAVTLDDFKGMFSKLYTCVKAVTLTDRYETEGSETVCKVEPGTAIELHGIAKTDEAGLLRSEGKVGEHKGWITISQKSGPTFLKQTTRIARFHESLGKTLSEVFSLVQKSFSSIVSKTKQAPNDEPAMKEARAELGKLKERVMAAQKSMDELKRNVEAAKREFTVKERAERNAHIDARNMKEAAPFLEAPKAKLDAVLAAEKAAEEVASPMVSLVGEALLEFATPASVQEAMEKANADVAEKVSEVKTAIAEQLKAASDVNPQTAGTGEAKKQLKQMQATADAVVKNISKMLNLVKTKCGSIVNPKLESTGAAIRKYAQKHSLSGEALFDKFKTGDKITESGFCKLLDSIEEVSISSEVGRLVCQKLEPGSSNLKDGVSKTAFMNFVVVYYKVVKTIAFTDALDVSSCKTIRKAAIGEIIEMLEEPVKEEANGITRIRAKATKEPILEGWVTVSGNQGSAFLERYRKH